MRLQVTLYLQIIQLVDRSIQSASASQSLAVAMGVVNVLSRIESLCQKIVPLHSSLDMLWKSLEQQLMIHLKSDNDKVRMYSSCICLFAVIIINLYLLLVIVFTRGH